MPRKTAASARSPHRRGSPPRGRRRLVFEIGAEELPPAVAWDAARQLREAAGPALAAARIPAGEIVAYSTPRRIVLIVEAVAPRQDDLLREVRGPASRVAFASDGAPTRAAEGFARAQGVAVDQLVRRTTPQGDYVYALQRSAGEPAIKALGETLPALAASLVVPKPMRWGPNAVRFARPIRWLLALLGREVVPFSFAGVESARTTYGHRILSPRPFQVADARAFESALQRHRVLLDPAGRRRVIVAAATRVAREGGGRPILAPDLLEETIQLLEWPAAFAGRFAAEFMVLPREVLITVMQHHQKYFAVEDASGRLLPAFVALRNGGTRGLRTVREGNEWVLRARLADARFFFDEDRKRPLETRVPELAGLVVHEKLGTMEQKTHRLTRLADRLGAVLALGPAQAVDLRRAAFLSKADLVTQMVRELPELQGVIGGIYARLDGEPEPVCEAIREQYLPRGRALPGSEAGAYLAVLDKLDTLVTALAAGLAVSGSQDPYGLRRAAQGIVAIVLDRHLHLDVRRFVRDALAAPDEAVVGSVMDLLGQRLRAALIESGISYDTVDAVLKAGADDLAAAADRAGALWEFRQSPEFPSVYTTFDRAERIVPRGFAGAPSREMVQLPAEKDLYHLLHTVTPAIRQSLEGRQYASALQHLARFPGVVDRFFTEVLVMDENERLRTNRLALLHDLVQLLRPIADVSSLVVGEGKPSGSSK